MGKDKRDHKRQMFSVVIIVLVIFTSMVAGWSVHSYCVWRYGGPQEVYFIRLLIDITRQYQGIIATIGSFTSALYIIKKIYDLFFRERRSRE